ncbi:hypothetical protein NDU88_005921 [Pleurodeles waltl]|uniref:Uncharacterized protein n=1 Tax=Pleurodeles waltl TaxID=8319 RepID=A0AAV7N774_PLEWA|nr:hypothetical protein NDU88_005921 [Pleurodeles waltl]
MSLLQVREAQLTLKGATANTANKGPHQQQERQKRTKRDRRLYRHHWKQRAEPLRQPIWSEERQQLCRERQWCGEGYAARLATLTRAGVWLGARSPTGIWGTKRLGWEHAARPVTREQSFWDLPVAPTTRAVWRPLGAQPASALQSRDCARGRATCLSLKAEETQ